jgi:hypothetical protein
MERPKSQSKRALVVATLILLPVVYVLSIGPFCWASLYYIGWQETQNPGQNPAYEHRFELVMSLFYAPVFWLADHWPPLVEFLDWYMNLFGAG